MTKLMVNTIYPAFMGEVSKYGIGVKCTFVRLSGCNLRCYEKTLGSLCDTPEALEVGCGKEMDHWDILQQVNKCRNKLVCITGGEPLNQDLDTLLRTLSVEGYNVVIETNGSICIGKYKHFKNVSFIVDCKGRSSGESERMCEDNYALMDSDDYLKFVLFDVKDYIDMSSWVYSHPFFKGVVAVGLFWGSGMKYQDLMDNIHKDRLDVVLNMQTHKMAVLYDSFREEASGLNIPKEL